MKFILSMVLLLGLSASSRAQQIDSFSYNEIPNGDTFLYFRVILPSTHFKQVNYGAGVVSYSPRIDEFGIYFLECDSIVADSIWEDSLTGISGGLPNPYTFILNTFADTNCGPFYSFVPVDQKTYIFGSSTGMPSSTAVPTGSITVSPNPASSTITLRNPGNLKLRMLRLYNMTGQLLLDEPASKSAFSIAHLPAGLYTAVIETDSGPVYQKLLIQH